MKMILISDMTNASETVLSSLGDLATGRVLVIDSAGPAKPGSGKPRGGTAGIAYAEAGASVEVADLLETGPLDLSGVDVVHFTGGDPFRLLRACRETGFLEAMEDRGREGDFAVVGSSAGAMVMGRDIGHASILCDPKGMADTSGFGWVDGLVMSHMDMEGAYADTIRSHVSANPDRDWFLLCEHDVQIMEKGEGEPGPEL